MIHMTIKIKPGLKVLSSIQMKFNEDTEMMMMSLSYIKILSIATAYKNISSFLCIITVYKHITLFCHFHFSSKYRL